MLQFYFQNIPSSKSNLVLVDSARANLENVALGVVAGRAVCLQGPVGCGKTALVEHLATVTGWYNLLSPRGYPSLRILLLIADVPLYA